MCFVKLSHSNTVTTTSYVNGLSVSFHLPLLYFILNVCLQVDLNSAVTFLITLLVAPVTNLFQIALQIY